MFNVLSGQFSFIGHLGGSISFLVVHHVVVLPVTAVVVALRGYKAGAEPFVPSPREEERLRLGPVGMALRGCAPEEPGWVNSLDWLHKTALCAY